MSRKKIHAWDSFERAHCGRRLPYDRHELSLQGRGYTNIYPPERIKLVTCLACLRTLRDCSIRQARSASARAAYATETYNSVHNKRTRKVR